MKIVIGITGGIATGKSFVSNYIRRKGFKVIDSDLISHYCLTKDGPCYQAVISAFSESILTSSGDINRSLLGQIIFNDKRKRLILNNIVHPMVRNEITKEIETCTDNLVFVDIPLLYEAEFDNYCDKVILVYVSRETQIERLTTRDSITSEYALKKIESQMNLETKRTLADYIIDSSGSFEDTSRLIDKVLIDLEEEYELHI